MSISYAGFQRESIENIIERIVGQLIDAKPNISITPDNPFYQLAKICASEILRTQILLEEAYKNMTIVGATGVWLDAHGIESGLGRRKASYATGTAKMTGDADELIPIETVFNTSDNKEYICYESVSIPAYDSVLKSVGDGFDIPLPVYDATIDSIRTDVADENTAMNNALWYMTDGHITFRNPATDFVYNPLILTTTESTSDVSTDTNIYLTDGSTVDDYYNGDYMKIGTEYRKITDYTGSTKLAIVSPAFSSTPSDGVAITLYSYTVEYIQDVVPASEPNDGDIWIPTENTTTMSNYQIFTITGGEPDNILTPTEGQMITDTGGDNYLYYSNTIWNVTDTVVTVGGGRITAPGTPTNGVLYYADATFTYNSSTVYKDRVYEYQSTPDLFVDQDLNINGSVIDITGDQDYVYINGWQVIPTASYTVDDLTTTIYGLTEGNTYMMNNPTEKWDFIQWMIYIYNTTTKLYDKTIPVEFNNILFGTDNYVYYNSMWSKYIDVTDGTPVYVLYDQVSFDINIRAANVGAEGNTAAYTINECSDFSSYDITNINLLVNGMDVEICEEYKERMLKTRRGNFNTWSIKRRLLETQSIRLARVYQGYGTDRAEMKVDGTYGTTTYKNTYAGGTGGFTNHYGFTFYPNVGIATLKGITLHGSFKGEPDWLDVRIYKATYVSDDLIDYTVFDDSYIRKILINPKELDEQPSSTSVESPAQEIFIPFDYAKMENSSTYVVVIMGSSNDDANHYWHIFYGPKTIATPYWRTYAFADSAVSGDPTNNYPYVKTHHGINAYNIAYVAQEGYTETDVLSDIQISIDTENGYGFQPAGVLRVVTEAEIAYINLDTKIVVDARYNSDLVIEQIKSDIILYCDNLDIGENLTYSKIEYLILNNPGVLKAYDTKISLNDRDYIATNEAQDIVITNIQYAKFNIAGEGDWSAGGNVLKGVNITVV